MESYSVSLILKSKTQFKEEIIDPLSFIFINWGIPETLIDWQIYKDQATLQVDYDQNQSHFAPFSMNYQEFNYLLELCYEYELHLKIICTVNHQSSTIEYYSPFQEVNFSII